MKSELKACIVAVYDELGRLVFTHPYRLPSQPSVRAAGPADKELHNMKHSCPRRSPTLTGFR